MKDDSKLKASEINSEYEALLARDLTTLCGANNSRGNHSKRNIMVTLWDRNGNILSALYAVCMEELGPGQTHTHPCANEGWVVHKYQYHYQEYYHDQWNTEHGDLQDAGVGYYWKECWIDWSPGRNGGKDSLQMDARRGRSVK